MAIAVASEFSEQSVTPRFQSHIARPPQLFHMWEYVYFAFAPGVSRLAANEAVEI